MKVQHSESKKLVHPMGVMKRASIPLGDNAAQP